MTRCLALALALFPFLPLQAAPLVIEDCLVLRDVVRAGRSPLRLDPVEQLLVTGKWKTPKAGDTLKRPDGETATWEAVKAKDGAIPIRPSRFGGGATYVLWKVTTDTARVMILEASGHFFVSVNGEPRAGDVYRNGIVNLPVALRKGDNELLFLARPGDLRARLVPPKENVYLDPRDSLLPDVVTGIKDREEWGAVLVVNATEKTQDGLALRAEADGANHVTRVPPLLPLSLRKVPFRLPVFKGEKGPAKLTVRLMATAKDAEKELSRATFDVGLVKPQQHHRRTFLSDIDGSVQFYAVLPARTGERKEPPALVLTLHGAGVNADGQSGSYSPKTWATIVAPTNRRPFGFDWEDWGRLDALEVLEHAQKEQGTDPRRVYLTGHSMGGHGTWHLGVTYPDRFAAIGPSAGWISFETYGGGRRSEKPTPVQEMILRAASAGDTFALARNCAQHAVYVLHGDRDDNVPVGQAREMRTRLTEFHHDFWYHEQAGAGHWWSAGLGSGTDCVDWGPMFELFSRRSLPLPEAVHKIDFTTACPGVSARSHWLTVEAQEHCMQPSRVEVQLERGRRLFRGTTRNVARLSLDLSMLPADQPVNVDLDGVKLDRIAWPKGRLWLQRKGDAWTEGKEPAATEKTPRRYGPFKEAFRNRMLFVYGTKGNAEENAWALAKARYDAETFWYRGNGSIDVIADTAFDPKAKPDRNVILYGHAESNAAWKSLLGDSPIQVKRGVVRIDDEVVKGDDLVCLFVRPRPGSDTALVGVVSGSGVAGLRLTERMAYFVSGSGFPDILVAGSDMLTRGQAGLRCAGFFGSDWSMKNAEIAWNK